MNNSVIKIFFSIAAMLLAAHVHAHGRWVVPSHTVLSGEDPEYVTFDISISNDIFYPDHAVGGIPEEKLANDDAEIRKVPPPIKALLDSSRIQLTKPDGAVQSDYTLVDFHRKSVASALLDQDGTYRISLVQNPIYFTWFEKPDNSRGRLFGKAEKVKALLPKGAKNIRTTKLYNTVETYITRNDGDGSALEASNNGLELKYLSHPNELFVGERFNFKVLFDGKAKEGVGMHLIRNDTRYRNDRETIELVSNDKGLVTVEWKKPGLYLLEMEFEKDASEDGVTLETHANYIVFEVFPE